MNSSPSPPPPFKSLSIKKYPYLTYSSNLLEYFIIIGYDNIFIKNKLLPFITASSPPDISSQKPFKFTPHNLPYKPTILNNISSDYKKSMLDEEMLITLSFPSSPKSYSTSSLSHQCEPSPINIVFLINGDALEEKSKITFHGNTFIFYEPFHIDTTIAYIPKAFVVISQFPLFNLYNSLCRDILKLFRDTSLEIPIEILIYNIVNFTPSPINISYTLTPFPNMSLSSYKHLSKTATEQNIHSKQIIINQASGYPIIDFNLCEIFNIYDISFIIEIFIYSILECEMIFFSKNIEMLNIVMYLISILSFPCNDTMYLWHIVSVDKESIINPNSFSQFVGKPFSSMIGINCEFEEEISTGELYHTHFIIDLDKKEILLRYDSDDYDNESLKQEIDELILLKEYIEDIVEQKSKVESHFIRNAIMKLVNELDSISNKIIMSNSLVDGASFVPSFFGYKNMNANANKSVQEIFYNFLLDLLGEFYKYYTMKAVYENNDEDNESSNDKSEKHKCGDGKYYYMLYKENFTMYSQCEIIFARMFISTQRYIHFIKEFISSNTCFDIYKISLLFSEEFLQLKKINEDKFTSHFFEIIDMFYTTNTYTFNEDQNTRQSIIITANDEICFKPQTNITNINFTDFYIYYNNNYRKYFFDELLYHPFIKTNPKVRTPTYSYKSISLDSSLLSKYVHLIMNIPLQKRYEIFPCLLLKKENEITDITISSISTTIEKSLIRYKAFTSSHILTHSTLYIASFLIQCIDNIKYITMLINLLKEDVICIRKYITLLIKSLYSITYEKSAKGANVKWEWMLYMKLMDVLRECNVIPNEELLVMFDEFAKMESGDDEEVFVKEDGEEGKLDEMYTCELNCNWCKECGVEFNREHFILLSSNIEYNGLLKEQCEECGGVVVPGILFKNLLWKRAYEISLYSPLKIINECLRCVEEFYYGKVGYGFYQKIKNVLINLMFYYMDEKYRDMECIMRFLFKCLCEVCTIQKTFK